MRACTPTRPPDRKYCTVDVRIGKVTASPGWHTMALAVQRNGRPAPGGARRTWKLSAERFSMGLWVAADTRLTASAASASRRSFRCKASTIRPASPCRPRNSQPLLVRSGLLFFNASPVDPRFRMLRP